MDSKGSSHNAAEGEANVLTIRRPIIRSSQKREMLSPAEFNAGGHPYVRVSAQQLGSSLQTASRPSIRTGSPSNAEELNIGVK